ncbi:TetR/AcrR family transcriptional regulator [Actinophytocola sp.]|uniref:TetR/AcrR family transcriptional regulator n=1 Tax=Actinophytocola sp. TaxID=1872138 RepID=UPI003D6A74BE
MTSKQGVKAAGSWREVQPTEHAPILAGARQVFHEKGYHGASVRDIAARAGVTVPALYYHYKNKQAMLVAVLELNMVAVLARVERALDDAGDRPEKRMAHLVEAIVLHLTREVGAMALDREMRYLEPENRKHYVAMRKRLEVLLVEIIDKGTAEGVFHPVDSVDTARALLGMCQAITTWFDPHGPSSPEDMARQYAKIALNAVGARTA